MSKELSKNDFIEFEYTGRIKNGGIFDTNIKEEAKKINLEIETKPLIICLGQNMILPAIDEFLIGKESEKEYTLEISPEKAFGSRDRNLIKTMPLSVFRNQNSAPQPGMVFIFDNMFGKITAVSGGRVIVDFNNPLAGKDIIYSLNVKRKIKDEKEKVSSLMIYFFKRVFPFNIEAKKLIVSSEKKFEPLFIMFKQQFKDVLGLDIEVKIEEGKEEEKKEEKAEKEHEHNHKHSEEK